MKTILIILILSTGIAHGQIKINVYSTDKVRWDAAASAAKNAETKAAEAAALANKRSLFIQGPGITFKQVDSNTYIISSEYPPRMTTAKRDSLDVKTSRGMFIYNLDKDACEVCNGLRWNQVTTGIVATEPVPVPVKPKNTMPAQKSVMPEYHYNSKGELLFKNNDKVVDSIWVANDSTVHYIIKGTVYHADMRIGNSHNLFYSGVIQRIDTTSLIK